LGKDLDPQNGLADPILGYQMPDDLTPNTSDIFWIDENTGTVTWDATQAPAGEYNIAILIEEFRSVNGTLIKMGHVIRDMQILVLVCDNDPPVLPQMQDTCVVAFTNLSFMVTATDPNNNPVNVSASGGPFTQVSNPAFFTPGSGGTGQFSWTPGCTEIRLAPYQVVFQATDISPTINLTTYMTMNIRVIAPPVQNPQAEAQGNSINLSWNTHGCLNFLPSSVTSNAQYKIYRRQGLYGFEPGHCETGVPAYTGYQLIATVNGLTSTTYTDTQGVFYGGEFCYMVVMCLPDGSESIASEEFCAAIAKEMPVITNASVEATDELNGELYIAWSPANELDTELFPGPYRYELLHGVDGQDASVVVFTSPDNPDLLNGDTTFVHTGINTLTSQHTYRVNLWSGSDFVGSSATATSIFLETDVDDQQITLFMNYNVPWVNESYAVYRRDPGESAFTLIDITDDIVYTDTSVENNTEYCYYVTSTGGYNAPGMIDPIENNSQEVCAVAVDLTPPCVPTFFLDDDCENETLYLSWTNPNNSCEETDDGDIYHLWFSPTEKAEFSLLAVIDNFNDTTLVLNSGGILSSIAGCYAITALDSLTPGLDGDLRRNESEFSNVVCVDNCPYYELPNIFSPNNDGINDVFRVIAWRHIASVDFFVFSRWGTLVFETNDLQINWDGTHMENGEICPDGTYFYTARVNTIRLSGVVAEEISGTITLVNGLQPHRE
jgi:gliding motility-associated-like protein